MEAEKEIEKEAEKEVEKEDEDENEGEDEKEIEEHEHSGEEEEKSEHEENENENEHKEEEEEKKSNNDNNEILENNEIYDPELMQEALLIEQMEAEQQSMKPTTKKILLVVEKYPTKKLIEDLPESCPICFKDFAKNDEVIAFGCKHTFHDPCIGQWLMTRLICPVCRMCLEKANSA